MTVRVGRAAFDPGAESNRFLAEAAGAGAAVSFTGLVRSSAGRQVTALELDCYEELAIKEIGRMIETARARFGLIRAEVIHRHGLLAAGEPIVQVMVLASHRQAAFAGAEYLMDRLKTDAPFWKKEHGPEGARWVAAQAEDDAARARWERD